MWCWSVTVSGLQKSMLVQESFAQGLWQPVRGAPAQCHPDHHGIRHLHRAGSARRRQTPGQGLYPAGRHQPEGTSSRIVSVVVTTRRKPPHRVPLTARNCLIRGNAMTVATLFTQLGMETGFLNAGTLKVKSPIDGEALASLRRIHPAPSTRRSRPPKPPSKPGDRCLPPCAANWCVSSVIAFVSTKPPSLNSLRWSAARSPRKPWVKCREMIDICDFAVGLSRQLYGLTIVSERPGHRLQESWHPLGITGVISAFNFPMAVWAWNTSIALVCGNSGLETV